MKADNLNKIPITDVGASKAFDYDNTKILIDGVYNIPKKVLKAFTSVDFNSAKVEVDYDSSTKESILSVIKALDSSNEVTPSISLRTGQINYSWLRKWEGGSLKSKLFPGKLVDLEWKDKGFNGAWTTNVKVPLQSDDKCSLSLVREWKF